MKVITVQMRADAVAVSWRKAYPEGHCYGHAKDEIYVKLVALGDHPDPNVVDKIIGNSSWTRLACSECQTDCDLVVECGEEPDYESATAHLCIQCIEKIVTLINKVESKEPNE